MINGIERGPEFAGAQLSPDAVAMVAEVEASVVAVGSIIYAEDLAALSGIHQQLEDR